MHPHPHKRYIAASLLLTLLVSSCASFKVTPINKQSQASVSGGMLYALPLTQLRITVITASQDLSQADFAAFAEEMLGDTDSTPIPNSIRDIKITTTTVADPKGYYWVTPLRSSMQTNSRHLLQAIGFRTDAAPSSPVSPAPAGSAHAGTTDFKGSVDATYNRADTFYTRHDQPGRPSKIVAMRDHRSLRSQAQQAARRIEELQHRRMQLLNGEEETPLDPRTLTLLLDKIEAELSAYIARFRGVIHLDTVTIVVDPTSMDNEDEYPLLLFSPSIGIVQSNQKQMPTDVDTLWCSQQPSGEMKTVARIHKYHATRSSRLGYTERHSIKYRIPEPTTISLTFGDHTWEQQVDILQNGPTVRLPIRCRQALFDPQTGTLLFYSAR
ncbi:MAG: DUF4831 family protein [Bacteroidales bacterium]|nr:DUF4831 family protein [Bacteroidales bacterium]